MTSEPSKSLWHPHEKEELAFSSAQWALSILTEYSVGSQETSCCGHQFYQPEIQNMEGKSIPDKDEHQEHWLSHPQPFLSVAHLDQVTGQEDTKPCSRCSSLSDALPDSWHMYHPSIEACLPCDLHQGFCSLVYSVVVRPRREMGDISCLTEKMWSANMFFLSLHFWSLSSGSMFFPEKKSEEAPGGRHRPDERVCKSAFMPLLRCLSTALSPLL